MKIYIIRKLLVVAVILAPLFINTDCQKQAKCGCEGDVLYTLEKEAATVYYNETGTNITFTTLNNPYATYNFCNPGEMFPKFADYKSGDVLLVSGSCFWECNYLYQSSNYSYTSYYKVYMINVTDVTVDLYGKK